MKLAALLAVIAPLAGAEPARAGTPRPEGVEGGVTVPRGKTRTLTLRCPRSSVALNGAVRSLGTGVVALGAIPNRDARRWTFRFAGLAAGDRRAAAVLRCVRLALPRRARRLKLLAATEHRPGLTVPASSTRRFSLRCPRGFIPTGWGLDAARPTSASGGLRISSAAPGRRSWAFELANPGARRATGSLHVRCLERSQTARRGDRTLRHTFRTRRLSYRDDLGRDAEVGLSHSCGRGEFSVATGASFESSGGLALSASHPSRAREADWRFTHRAGRRESVETHLLCLDLSSHFRRAGRAP